MPRQPGSCHPTINPGLHVLCCACRAFKEQEDAASIQTSPTRAVNKQPLVLREDFQRVSL